MSDNFNLDTAIRKVQDFPKPGILFYDITSILMDPEAFSYCISQMEKTYSGTSIDCLAAVESRGFIFASPYAIRQDLPLALVRKKGKLPGETKGKEFELEYGTDKIEIHTSDIRPGMNVLIVDDLIATGGTIRAACDLISEAGANVVGVFSVIGLPFLNYQELMGDIPVKTLIEYNSE